MSDKFPEDSQKEDDILVTIRTRLDRAMTALNTSRQYELDDLRFLAGSPDNNWQWPSSVLNNRVASRDNAINARPCLTINKLPQHVRQVTNEQRQNRPSGKVIPVNDDADIEIAEIFEGLVRHIEYISDADIVYDTACENQVTYGEGYFRLATEYCAEDSFDQEIKLLRIRNSFSVYMDPTIQDPCGADAKWCFITEDLSKAEFERLYPNAQPISSLLAEGVNDQGLSDWIQEDMIRVAEYFYIEYSMEILNLYGGGETVFENTPEDIQLKAMYGKPQKSREVARKQIKWVKTNGYEILEKRDWAGKWIPVIRVVGNEYEIDGLIYVSGLVRNAKDPQRMYNYWTSCEAEMLALAPKAPFIGYSGQFEGFEDQWETANVNNWPYLEVNSEAIDGQGNPLPLPQRSLPPMAQTGLLQAKMGASDDIKATTGQYDSSLGATSNERSGKAILAREKQGDTGTYHYGDNLTRAIRFGTRQIIDLGPKIYDTKRWARIIGLDGSMKQVQLDPNQPEAVRKIVDQNGIVMQKVYNINVGVYDVCATTGPGYMTKRQEAMDAMGQILQGNPELWKVAGDLFAKNMDWPGAQELSERLAKTIDPKLLGDDDKSPELQAAEKQIQSMAGEMDAMHKMLQDVPKSIEVRELKVKEYQAQTDRAYKEYQAETDRLKVTQAGMTPEQIQDIVLGTLHSAMHSGDIAGNLPASPLENPAIEPQIPPNQPQEVIPENTGSVPQ